MNHKRINNKYRLSQHSPTTHCKGISTQQRREDFPKLYANISPRLVTLMDGTAEWAMSHRRSRVVEQVRHQSYGLITS